MIYDVDYNILEIHNYSMSYNQKIQLLESRLAELDNTLKIIEAVAKETWDSFTVINEKIKLHHNKIDRLQIEIKELIDSNKTDVARKKLDEMKQELTQATTLTETVTEIAKRGTMTNMEKYRNQNESIRKITPEVSIIIDEKIQKFEISIREFMSLFDFNDPKDLNVNEINIKSEKSRIIETELIQTISLVQKCIKSTLDVIRS